MYDTDGGQFTEAFALCYSELGLWRERANSFANSRGLDAVAMESIVYQHMSDLGYEPDSSYYVRSASNEAVDVRDAALASEAMLSAVIESSSGSHFSLLCSS